MRVTPGRRALQRCLTRARRGCVFLGLLLVACAPPPPPPTLELTAEGALVVSESPIRQVELRGADGIELFRRELPPHTRTVSIPGPFPPGEVLTLRVQRAEGLRESHATVPARAPDLSVRVEVPTGQGARPLLGDLPVPVFGGGQAQGTVTLLRRSPGRVTLRVGDAEEDLSFARGGERVVRPLSVRDRPVEVEVRDGERLLRGTLRPQAITVDEALAFLVISASVFPADRQGRRDPAQRADRIALPASIWQRVLDRTGLGTRPRDAGTPLAFDAITLTNHGALGISVVVTSEVLGADGRPHPAFAARQRMATGDTPRVSLLVHVPAGATRVAALPVYVDPRALPAAVEVTARTTITPLGSDAPLLDRTRPLRVTTASGLVSGGVMLLLVGAAAGWILLLSRLPAWLREPRTADLVTIAVFGMLTFTVSSATLVFGAGVAAALGPFAVLITGLIDDVVQVVLLATLVTLFPRPGAAALVVLVAGVMRGVALGGFGPTDVLFVPARVFWLEGALWLAGVPRGRDWRDDGALARGARLFAGLGGAGLLSTFASVLGNMALFRLYYADWYVAAVVLGPGFLYALPACALAVPFADSLRKVQP